MAFSRLKLLLLCGIFIFFSLQHSDANIEVHEGELRPVNCSTAILSMSGDSTHKSVWWQFLPLLQTYLEAFRVYMMLPTIQQGPQCKVEERLQEIGGLPSTRNASIAEDISVTNVKSLGSMTISMWMLGFICPEGVEDPCKKLTPAVLRKDPSGNLSYELFSVWEVDEDVVRNTAAGRILDLPNTNLDVQHFGEHAITFRSIRGNQDVIPLCGNRTPSPRKVPDVVPLGNCSENKPVHELKPLCIVRENGAAQVEKLIESFMLQVRNSYIQAQTSAVNLEQGPASEFSVAAIAFPGAFIAVVAAAIPFTDYLLKLVRRKVLARLKILLICIVNSAVAIVSYAAVLTLVPAELERQKSYKTWGLLADEVPVIPRGLQVLIVVQGKSDYTSSSLILVWISLAFMVPIMVLITFYRCNQVAERQKLLRKLRELRPDEPGDERVDDLRAIEMTSADQELLEKRLENLENAGKSFPSHITKSSRSLGRSYTEVRLRVDRGPR